MCENCVGHEHEHEHDHDHHEHSHHEHSHEQNQHKACAIQCFNGTWDLLDKPDRTREEDMLMLHTAHASRFHWSYCGTHVNLLRGEWQVSRVCSELKLGESALLHGQYCYDLCIEHDVKGFDLAFAYEALARAYAVLGDESKKSEMIQKGLEAAEGVPDKDDKDYCIKELNSIK